MDVYILDDRFRRESIIDKYESMIWTERYREYGDFELKIQSTSESRGLLTKGTRLSIVDSKRVMVIENLEDVDDEEGRSILTATGYSLEYDLKNRSALEPGFIGTEQGSMWSFTGTPKNIIISVFDAICRFNTSKPQDKIPYLTEGQPIFPPDTNEEPDTIVTIEIPITDLYQFIKDVCDTFDLGFRLVADIDNEHLYFDIYVGNDRTTSQDDFDAVIFSPDLENLTNVSDFSSTANYKNVAYVISQFGVRTVYGENIDPSISGFDRKVLTVDATDIDLPAGAPLQDLLELRGLEELAKHKSLSAMDGEIPTSGNYVYGEDYNVGDLVEMRNADGVTNIMRVTEQIIVNDSEGKRSYPTLTTNLFITPGSWYSYEYDIEWDDAVGTWDDQPE